jgi:CheY-like chemotaxis protein
MRRRVLVVDDDDATRIGLRLLLEKAGYETVAVRSFQEAREALLRDPPDLLIADVRLGAFNGLQLVLTSPVPVAAIIVTGYHDAVIEAETREVGADYLVKPIEAAALLSLIDRRLADAQGRPTHRPARRWERKRVIGGLAANVDESPARILDVSYGGLRIEIEQTPAGGLPPSFTVDVPAPHLSVPVDVVWTIRGRGWSLTCGAAVAHVNPVDQRAWFGLVDVVA